MQLSERLNTLRQPLREDGWPVGLIVLWTLLMISIPIQRWVIGDDALSVGMTLGVVVQASAVLAVLVRAWGWREVGRTAVIVSVLTFGVEWLGSTTGFPFGPYDYTERLQPQLFHVPLLIPLAWLMMLPAAWAVADRWRARRWQFVAVSALALTAWDLFLDPQMVAWNFWVWDNPGGYFGIPWSNYFGWLLTAAVVTLVVKPKRLPVRPLLTIYTITWFLQTFGLLFFWAMPGPAIVGGVVMGGFVWLGWRGAATSDGLLTEA